MELRTFFGLLPTAISLRSRESGDGTLGPSVQTYAQLEPKLAYLAKVDQRLVREAYQFADKAHLGQLRKDGLPYITHPVAVAGLVADLHLDVQALMAALLHDVLEDCGVEKSELVERFGAPTAELVDGLTKLDKLRFSTREEGQAESFRKMLMAMSRDVRVILVKLADRLHNMRTLGAMSAGSRGRIARETLDIYVPIAHHLGLNQLYRELQECAFEAVHPWRFAVLTRALAAARGMRRDIVGRVHREVQQAFTTARMKVQITGREKSVYSIYRKMRDKRSGFARVNDLFGLRVVVPAVSDCYLGLGVLHQLYRPVPGRFKDYIAIAKPNGYRSLHTTLVNPLGAPVEVQLRTQEMHAVAENGVAAHWLYKQRAGQSEPQGTPGDAAQRLGTMWLKSLMDIQQDTLDSGEFIEHVKIDLVPEEVYVFTPQSKILALPRGATPVDFAYTIHSRVGDHCVAARINDEAAALHTPLHSGDVVEIITNPAARPNPNWLNFVRTGRARAKIRHHLRNLAHDESLALGLKLLTQTVQAEGLTLPPTEPQPPSDGEAQLHPLWPLLLRWCGVRQVPELLLDIGLGKKNATIVGKRAAQLLVDLGDRPDPLRLAFGALTGEADAWAAGPTGVVIDGSEGGSVRMASCCHPIPGDAVVGYLGRGEGLVVHTADCHVGRRQYERDPERWMGVAWSQEPVRTFDAAVHVLVANGKGTLAQVAQAVSACEADISHIDMGEASNPETADLNLLIAVRNRLHLADVLRALKRTPSVLRVQRAR